VKPQETECPHCGASLRRADGTARRTALALVLGLTAVTIPTVSASCSDDESTEDDATTTRQSSSTEAVSAYGAGPFGGYTGSPSAGGMGGAGGQSSDGGSGGMGGAGGK